MESLYPSNFKMLLVPLKSFTFFWKSMCSILNGSLKKGYIYVLIPRTCECYLIWIDGFYRCDEIRALEMRKSSWIRQVTPKFNVCLEEKHRRDFKLREEAMWTKRQRLEGWGRRAKILQVQEGARKDSLLEF